MTTELRIEMSVQESGKGKRPISLSGDISGEVTLEELRDFNQRALRSIDGDVFEEEKKKGFDPEARIRTDGRWDRPPELVKPFGRIERYSRASSLEVIEQIYRAIVDRSPIRTGMFIRSNYVFFNGRLIASNMPQLKAWLKTREEIGVSNNDKIRFVNVTPYAARREIAGTRRQTKGRDKGSNVSRGRSTTSRSKSFSGQVKKPNGAYYLAYRSLRTQAMAASRLFKFEFMPNGTDGIFVPAQLGFRNTYAMNKSTNPRKRKRIETPYVYPSIVLKFSDRGVIQ